MGGPLLLFVMLGISVTNAALPNIACIMVHCASEAKDCFEDADCKKAMMCMTQCGLSNQTCEFDCLYSYENDIFDNLMKCMVTDNKCMTIPPPKPPVVCHRPPKVDHTFDFRNLAGTWYIVYGKNPIYDCFNCQNTTFVSTTSQTFSAIEHFDVNAIDGTIKHRVVTDTVTQWNTSSPGILKYSSIQMGHETTSEWRILDFSEDFIFAYYCGSISADYFFEGSVVYSKKQVLSSNVISRLSSVATWAGLDFASFCKPTYSNCQK